MKLTSIIFTATMAVASVEALAAPQQEPDIELIKQQCSSPGNPCDKMKRAADAAADAAADVVGQFPEPPVPHQIWCWRPGHPCNKAKRDALALAEAVADAYASANPDALPSPDASRKRAPDDGFVSLGHMIESQPMTHHIWCYRPGQGCGKAKRDALAFAEAVADAHASANPDAKAEAEAAQHFWCWRPGQPCNKTKRAAEAIAEAIAEPVSAPNTDASPYARKNKRALDDLKIFLEKF